MDNNNFAAQTRNQDKTSHYTWQCSQTGARGTMQAMKTLHSAQSHAKNQKGRTYAAIYDWDYPLLIFSSARMGVSQIGIGSNWQRFLSGFPLNTNSLAATQGLPCELVIENYKHNTKSKVHHPTNSQPRTVCSFFLFGSDSAGLRRGSRPGLDARWLALTCRRGHEIGGVVLSWVPGLG